jgi:glycosyltransferase involved in cell wall biosynthesis
VSVGVIVPVYGRGEFLAEALDSVLSQDPPPDVVIVVDDGSPVPIVLPSAASERCRLVRRDERGGPGAARDTALEVLDTELIACADADDVWRPGKLAAQVRALGLHPEAMLCFGSAVVAGPDGRPTGERWQTLPAGVLEPSVLAPLLYEHNPIPTSSVVARRGAVVDAGGFAGPRLCEDWALWLRLLERGSSFVFEPDAVITYRRHPGGLTADISALAECMLSVHASHEGLVDEAVRRRVRAADLTALARGRVRERRYEEARAALAQAASLAAPSARVRAVRAVLALPLVRGVLGNRAPFRRKLRSPSDHNLQQPHS